MRTGLEKFKGQTLVFSAFFHRFGYKRGDSLAVLIEKVYHDGVMVTEHTWVPYSDEFRNLEINSGDHICFEATVTDYEKADSMDFGLKDAKNIHILNACGKKVSLDDISHFVFSVQPEMSVWRRIKGDKKEFRQDSDLEIQENVTIVPGDVVEIELLKIRDNGAMEYAWKIERDGRWNKGAIFNPIKYGQALIVYGFYQIYLPEEIYFTIKDYFFKLGYSMVNEITLPYRHEMKYYEKPDKFKNRKILNFDGEGRKITDKAVIEKRDRIFRNLREELEQAGPEKVLDILEKVYGTTSSVAPYLNERSPKFGDISFLMTKTANVFTSSPAEVKSRFLDQLIIISR